ncbi:MAG: sugar phosphate isomerase/epimerase family protein [Acidobacteriaceae bacterium]|jgi:sugar phosphate isomerase/epimerase
MLRKNTSRREFLAVAGVAAAGVLAGHAGAAPQPMRLGGPIFVDSGDPAVLAKAHRDLGYRAAYAPRDLSLTETDRIAGLVKEFARQDVVIAEVGAWKNMLDPDSEKRRSNMTYVTEKLALAEVLGARNCVDIAGSYDPNVWYGENPRNLSQEFFDATVENCRKLLDAVKPRRTFFSIEMMPWSLPTSPDEYVRLIKAVDRKAFGVHLDVCNTMNSPVRLYNNSAGIRECFSKLGPWIKSCHAKDLKWGPGVQVWIQEVVPGTGLIDYKTYLQELSGLGTDAPLMLEHLHSEEEYTKGREYIQGVARSMGLSFGN